MNNEYDAKYTFRCIVMNQEKPRQESQSSIRTEANREQSRPDENYYVKSMKIYKTNKMKIECHMILCIRGSIPIIICIDIHIPACSSSSSFGVSRNEHMIG